MINNPDLAEVLRGARVGLVLSAGFFGFYGHAGLMLALEQAGLKPAALSGSSAGALVSGYAAAGMPAHDLARLLLSKGRQDFWDPLGWRDLLRRDLPATGLLRGQRLHRMLQQTLPVPDFQSCQVPLFVEAANLSTGESEILHQGELARAIWASCAYPGLFLPVGIGNCLYWDGGLLNKAPVACLVDRVDAILIHWLPSSQFAAPLKLGLGAGRILPTLLRGFAMARRENARLQARVAMKAGLPVYVICPRLPRLGPFKLQRGQEALDAARENTLKSLALEAESALLDPLAMGLR